MSLLKTTQRGKHGGRLGSCRGTNSGTTGTPQYRDRLGRHR